MCIDLLSCGLVGFSGLLLVCVHVGNVQRQSSGNQNRRDWMIYELWLLLQVMMYRVCFFHLSVLGLKFPLDVWTEYRKFKSAALLHVLQQAKMPMKKWCAIWLNSNISLTRYRKKAVLFICPKTFGLFPVNCLQCVKSGKHGQWALCTINFL